MDPESEGDVPVLLAGHVETIRIGEMLGIPVGRADDGDDHGVLGDPLAPHLDLRRRPAPRALHGTVEAQELLDARLDQRRIGLEHPELVRVLEEGEEPVADQVDRGLVPGDEEEHAGGDQLTLAELVALFLGRDEAGEQIRLRILPARGDEGAEIVGEGKAGVPAARDDIGVGGQDARVEAPRDVGGPVLEHVLIRGGDAQHLADHPDGKRVGEVLDHVHGAGALDPVEEAVHDLLDVRAHHLDDPRREGAAHERAQTRVVRWILEQHVAGARGVLGQAEPGFHELGHALAAEARIAQDHDRVVVARAHPESERALVHGVFFAEGTVERIRIRVELRNERIEYGLTGCHLEPAFRT